MNQNNSSNDDDLCPLCGEANLCAVSEDPAASDCWCRHTAIPEAAIAAIPATASGEKIRKQCICQRCAERAALLATEI